MVAVSRTKVGQPLDKNTGIPQRWCKATVGTASTLVHLPVSLEGLEDLGTGAEMNHELPAVFYHEE